MIVARPRHLHRLRALRRLSRTTRPAWTAGSGAIFNLRSDHLRPAGWTSADAAGLPILPGLARYSEVAAGAIDHALRFTAPCTGALRVSGPARRGQLPGPDAPPMGLRVRLKASVNISGLPYQARVVAQALKRYGLILADNGSPWYISGAPDPRWNDTALHELGPAHRARLPGRRHELAAPPRALSRAPRSGSAQGVKPRRVGADAGRRLSCCQLDERDRQLLAFASPSTGSSSPARSPAARASAGAAQCGCAPLRQAGLIRDARRAPAGSARLTRSPRRAAGDRQPLPAPREVDLAGYRHDVGLAWLWLAARAARSGRYAP